MNAQLQGTALAVLMAGMFATTAATAAPPASESQTVMCAGINACKGQSACATASSACKGQNTCKGQGWLPVESEKVCTDKGGTVVKPEKKGK
jgi:uncharacterized membrane protein